ncbi:hypothetical protein LWI29_006935 [Acer saccharum]|uniref:Uncharacterized protein n=1 Tax=Acer saccharum TaxID=4024 RepID=A0AA39VKK1_ACESA|nr:hypothetical protein LWI29_006935 [Acer saccharum]
MGALDCFGIQVVNRESNPRLSLWEYVGLVELPLDDREASLIKHESPIYEEIIAQLKKENRMVRALNFELTTKLEEALKGQDDLVDEFTIRVSSIEEQTLQRDQLMRNKEEFSIAKKGKGNKVDHLLNLSLDKVKRISAMPIKRMAYTRCPHSKSQSAQVEPLTEQRSRRGKATVLRSSSKHPDYDQRLRQNKNRSLVVEKGLDFKDLACTSFVAESNEFLAGGSVRVRGKSVSFNAVDVNERLETMSYPQWANGYEPSKFYEMYNQTLANAIRG